jgi:hypothetical protein
MLGFGPLSPLPLGSVLTLSREQEPRSIPPERVLSADWQNRVLSYDEGKKFFVLSADPPPAYNQPRIKGKPMKKVYPAKDPSEILQYGFNWTPRNLGAEVITLIDADVISGSIAIQSAVVDTVPGARTGQGTVMVISGGVAGELCEINLTVTTDLGSVAEQTVYLPIRDK